jgi:hypothetical protein
MEITAVAADADDLVTLGQLLVDRRTDGAACAYQKNFHAAVP